MYGHSVLLVWLLFVIVKCVRSQEGQHQQLLNKLLCIEHEVCGQCVSAAAHCRWCADPYFGAAAPRCNDYDSLVAAGCGQDMIQRPEAPVLSVEADKPLQDLLPDSVDSMPVVQIQPQRIRLSLKPRETRKIKFAYRPARNYPLDLYYLMDLTWSMKDDKETLVSLRDDLPNLLKNLTDNFRLGFGSFADKPLMPYTSMVPRNLQNPCAAEEGSCEPTYSFHHHLSLTSQVTDFIETVKNSAVTANLDNAEAQLDALMQVLACGDQIGWSARSRKIVILLSDGLLHTAGDGLLAGVIKRNDEQCHLNKEGYYEAANIYDYPSIAQIYRLLEKYKVNVIFAVTENVKEHYDSLHKILEDFTYIAKLESDSSNILKLVKTGYENIISIVDFEVDSSLEQLKIKYFSDCGVQGGPMVETARCTGVEFGRTLNYEVHLTLETCPGYKKSTQSVRISESQLGQDSLSLEVEVQCGCTCENGTQLQRQRDMSAACPAHSQLVCGVCQCDSGWSGPTCSCSLGDEAASALLTAQCREPNATRAAPCSGFGDCLCGECACDRGFSGRYCQCRACEVSLDNHVECGGAGRGDCVCGVCVCAAGWGGAACDCTDGTDTCVAPGAAGSGVCSGHGECVCGRCQCSSSDGIKYSGAYCETCATCDNPLCAHAEPCVSCHLSGNCTALDEHTSVCVTDVSNYTVTERFGDANRDTSDDTWCILRRDDDGMECEYRYTYKAANQTMVHMEVIIRAKECSQLTSARLMTSGLVIMACVVAAGIILIIGVKIAQIISDRRAYAKFAAEAEWSIAMNERQQNPLYISPISEFRLPDSYPRDKNE